MVSKANAVHKLLEDRSRALTQSASKGTLVRKRRGACRWGSRVTVTDLAAWSCPRAPGLVLLPAPAFPVQLSVLSHAHTEPTFGSHLLLQNVYYCSPWQLLLLESSLMESREQPLRGASLGRCICMRGQGQKANALPALTSSEMLVFSSQPKIRELEKEAAKGSILFPQ